MTDFTTLNAAATVIVDLCGDNDSAKFLEDSAAGTTFTCRIRPDGGKFPAAAELFREIKTQMQTGGYLSDEAISSINFAFFADSADTNELTALMNGLDQIRTTHQWRYLLFAFIDMGSEDRDARIAELSKFRDPRVITFLVGKSLAGTSFVPQLAAAMRLLYTLARVPHTTILPRPVNSPVVPYHDYLHLLETRGFTPARTQSQLDAAEREISVLDALLADQCNTTPFQIAEDKLFKEISAEFWKDFPLHAENYPIPATLTSLFGKLSKHDGLADSFSASVYEDVCSTIEKCWPKTLDTAFAVTPPEKDLAAWLQKIGSGEELIGYESAGLRSFEAYMEEKRSVGESEKFPSDRLNRRGIPRGRKMHEALARTLDDYRREAARELSAWMRSEFRKKYADALTSWHAGLELEEMERELRSKKSNLDALKHSVSPWKTLADFAANADSDCLNNRVLSLGGQLAAASGVRYYFDDIDNYPNLKSGNVKDFFAPNTAYVDNRLMQDECIYLQIAALAKANKEA